MTKITFYQGLKEIGGTFVAVETKKARCMFDFGFSVTTPMDEKIQKRKSSYGADYIRLGQLPAVDGIYGKRTAQKTGVLPFGKSKKNCFFIISHMHIDHMGGLASLHQEIPVYMSEDSLRLYRRLEANGEAGERGHENCIGVGYGESFAVDDISVKLLPVDHDVVGACGFVITTPEGTVSYTGDYRFHGFHPELTEAFAKEAKGVDILITEGVSVSFSDVDMRSLEGPDLTIRTEKMLLEEFEGVCCKEKGLLVMNPYNRNVERLYWLHKSAEKMGRTVIFDAVSADYLSEFYPEERLAVYQAAIKKYNSGQERERWQIVRKKDLLKEPGKYVLQLEYRDMMELLDLYPVVSRYLHIDGAPLGSYDPSWQNLQAMLKRLRIPHDVRGIGGHAQPYGIKQLIDQIEPGILVPLHSLRPDQVQSEKAGRRILPAYGETIVLEDRSKSANEDIGCE